MSSVWTLFAKTPEETQIDTGMADGTVDGEFTVSAPEALPAHVEEFLNLKAASAF
ncbi:hypothetical protein sos41_01270 [Alphaproteobacteria bacterium SO-S41]|nr:hypothetical protein sos41_01270 [Alphaproteobacteria bacterium SO-S41]